MRPLFAGVPDSMFTVAIQTPLAIDWLAVSEAQGQAKDSRNRDKIMADIEMVNKALSRAKATMESGLSEILRNRLGKAASSSIAIDARNAPPGVVAKVVLDESLVEHFKERGKHPVWQLQQAALMVLARLAKMEYHTFMTSQLRF